jgi:hypothetical protein
MDMSADEIRQLTESIHSIDKNLGILTQQVTDAIRESSADRTNIWTSITELNHTIDGNGKRGLKLDVNDLIKCHISEKEKRERQYKAFWAIMIIFITLIVGDIYSRIKVVDNHVTKGEYNEKSITDYPSSISP